MDETIGTSSTDVMLRGVSSNHNESNEKSSKKIAYLHTFLSYSTFIVSGCIDSISGPTLTDLQQIIHEDPSVMGIVFTWRAVGLRIGTIIGGVLFDVVKRKPRLIILFMFFLSLTTISIPLCRSLTALSGVFFVGSIPKSALGTGINAYCLQIWGGDVGPYYQALHFMYAAGGLLGPLIAVPFQGHNNGTDSNNTLHNITSNSTSDGTWLSHQPRITYAFAIVSFMILVVTILWIVVYCTTSSKFRARNPKEDSRVVKLPGVRFTALVIGITCILVLCQIAIESSLSHMLAIYAEKGGYGFTKVEASYLTSVYWGAYMLARGSSIVVAYKLSEFVMLTIDIILLLLGSLTYVIGTPYSTYCIWIGTAIVGMGVASLFPSTLAWLDKHINVTNKIVAVISLVGGISEIVMPYILSKYMVVCRATLFYLTFACAVTYGFCFILISIAYKKQGKKYVAHTGDPSALIQDN